MTSNAYTLFNRDYLEEVDDENKSDEIKFKVKDNVNDCLLNIELSEIWKNYPILSKEEKEGLKFSHFFTRTVYPGLLIGIGNPHDAAGKDEAFKLGFSLDYVTGLPVIPGSTVKGVLKNNLRDYYDGWNEEKEEDKEKKQKIKEKIQAIFGDKDKSGNVVFLDAVPICGDAKDLIFADDYITPHGDDPLKNPTPLKMLKVRSGVTYEFRFLNLNEEKKFKLLNGEEETLLNLFEEVITTLGIGAKTNVGYGIMEKDGEGAEKAEQLSKKIKSRPEISRDEKARVKGETVEEKAKEIRKIGGVTLTILEHAGT